MVHVAQVAGQRVHQVRHHLLPLVTHETRAAVHQRMAQVGPGGVQRVACRDPAGGIGCEQHLAQGAPGFHQVHFSIFNVRNALQFKLIQALNFSILQAHAVNGLQPNQHHQGQHRPKPQRQLGGELEALKVSKKSGHGERFKRSRGVPRAARLAVPEALQTRRCCPGRVHCQRQSGLASASPVGG